MCVATWHVLGGKVSPCVGGGGAVVPSSMLSLLGGDLGGGGLTSVRIGNLVDLTPIFKMFGHAPCSVSRTFVEIGRFNIANRRVFLNRVGDQVLLYAS